MNLGHSDCLGESAGLASGAKLSGRRHRPSAERRVDLDQLLGDDFDPQRLHLGTKPRVYTSPKGEHCKESDCLR